MSQNGGRLKNLCDMNIKNKSVFLCMIFIIFHINSVYGYDIGKIRFNLENKTFSDTAYCALSDVERASYINMLKYKVRYLPYVKKTYNYNMTEDRDKKKSVEQSFVYNPADYPEQEAAYELGFLLSSSRCEILQLKQAIYYYSLAGRNPNSYFSIGILLYQRNPKSERAIRFFEQAAYMGVKQAAENAIILMRKEPELYAARLKELSYFYYIRYIAKR